MEQNTQKVANHPGLRELQREIAASTRNMSPEQLSAHPDGKWCASEVLEHLYLTYTGTIKGLNRVLEAGKPLAGRPTLRDRFRIFVVTGVGHLPEGRKAPAVATPKGLDADAVRSGVGTEIANIDQLLTQCANQFGAGTRVLDHPILGPLTVRQWRKFHIVHGRHHLKQIARLRARQQ